MNDYLKENLILGDWLENFFGWITLPLSPWESEDDFECIFVITKTQMQLLLDTFILSLA